MVSPAQKKQAVEHVIGQGLCSVRRACHYLGLHRSTYRYRPRQPLPQQIQLYQRIVALSWHYPRYGYRRIRALLAQEGWLVSRKQVQRIRGDNGTEFIAGKIQRWLRENQIKTLYIEPGSPWQNGYIESFHSRFRDECLNREWLLNLREARVVIEDWRLHYNTERPHSRLGYLSPEDYIKHQIVSP